MNARSLTQLCQFTYTAEFLLPPSLSYQYVTSPPPAHIPISLDARDPSVPPSLPLFYTLPPFGGEQDGNSLSENPLHYGKVLAGVPQFLTKCVPLINPLWENTLAKKIHLLFKKKNTQFIFANFCGKCRLLQSRSHFSHRWGKSTELSLEK